MRTTNRAYCTAPWVEMHLFQDGQTRLCDHNQESFGDWQKDGVETVWRSERYQEVRRKMASGEFPNEQCRSCYLNQTTSKLSNHVKNRFVPVSRKLFTALGREIPEVSAVSELLVAQNVPDSWPVAIAGFFAAAKALRGAPDFARANLGRELDQLEMLATVTKDFLSAEAKPRYVGPSRQARLINKCNARCIMCAGKFNGDIINGPTMDESHVAEVLSPVDHIFSFSSEASEFLLFRKWREIALKLSERGLPKLRIFTNGILATRENVRFLIDNNALETLHFSMNGASKEVIESGQVNVKFDTLLENIRFVFAYADEKKVDFHLYFSFIVMRRNYHEMPELLRLVHELRGRSFLKPVVYFAYLESNNDMDNYREFLFREHHALVDEDLLRKAFSETQELSEKFGIPVTLFESTLAEFLQTKARPPKLVCKERDIRVLVKFLQEGGDRSILKAVQGTTPRLEALLETIRSDPGGLSELAAGLLGRDLLLTEKDDVVLTGFSEIESTPANKWRWALGSAQKIEFTPFPGKNFITYRIQLPLRDSELVVKSGSEEYLKVKSARDRESIQGRIEFSAQGSRKTLEIEVSRHNEGPHRFSPDSRPLAFCVYSFEHSEI